MDEQEQGASADADGVLSPSTTEPHSVSALRASVHSALNCRYCQAAGLLEEYYSPRERRCAFPNEGRFVAGGGWGCPVEDALCELIRDGSRVCNRFYLGQDTHASLTRLWELWGEDAEPSAIWATWYKSRGNFEQIEALGWGELDTPKPLSFDHAVDLIRSSSRQTHYHSLFASAIEARRAGTEGSGAQHESAVPQADAKAPPPSPTPGEDNG
jgi:hypothetical protein